MATRLLSAGERREPGLLGAGIKLFVVSLAGDQLCRIGCPFATSSAGRLALVCASPHQRIAGLFTRIFAERIGNTLVRQHPPSGSGVRAPPPTASSICLTPLGASRCHPASRAGSEQAQRASDGKHARPSAWWASRESGLGQSCATVPEQQISQIEGSVKGRSPRYRSPASLKVGPRRRCPRAHSP